MRLPNFIIAGASKSGTTSLFNYLRQHPQICMPQKKELFFFNNEKNYSKGINYYSSFFRHCSYNYLTGESTPNYLTKLDTVPSRIFYHIPNVKLIFILRNPIEVSYSTYWYHISRGELNTPLSFFNLLKTNPSHWIFSSAFHADRLAHYFRIFPRKNIHVIFFDELKISPFECLEKICSFLEIEKKINLLASKKYNETIYPKNIKLYLLFKKYFPNIDRASSSNIILRPLRRRLFFKVDNNLKPHMTLDEKIALLQIFEPHIKRLEMLVHTDLSHWREISAL